MKNPSAQGDSVGEWIEVYNSTAADIDMEGLMLLDNGTDDYLIDAPVIVPAGGFAVLACDATALDGTGKTDPPDHEYDYGSYALGNTADEVILATFGTDGSDGDIIDEVWYDTSSFPNTAGASLSLDPDNYDDVLNDDGENWCVGASAYATGDDGTPGSDNDDCPVAPEISGLSPEEGSTWGGTTVVISGSNMDAITSVEFDGVAATIVGSPTTSAVTVTTPAGSTGTVHVEVITDDFSDTSNNAYTYGEPYIDTVDPADDWTDGGASVTVSGGYLEAVTQANFKRGGNSASAADVVALADSVTLTVPAWSHGDGGGSLVLSDGTEEVTDDFYFVDLADDIDWCQVYTEEKAEMAYGQIYIAKVTGSGKENTAIVAELGFTTELGLDPTTTNDEWTWAPADFNASGVGTYGNDDLYEDDLSTLSSGTYGVAFRFRYTAGDNTWFYCDGAGTSYGDANPTYPYDTSSEATITIY